MIYLSCHHLNNYGIDLMDALRTYENKFLGVPLELFNGKLVLLIDEAHAQKNWAAIIKDVYDRSKNVFVIISGSVALAFNTTTDLARRSVTEWLFPVSFMEYNLLNSQGTGSFIYPPKNTASDIQNALFFSDAKGAAVHIDNISKVLTAQYFSKIPSITINLENYMLSGGFPFLIGEKDNAAIYEKLIDILNRIIKEDMPLFSPLGKLTLSKTMPILLFLASNRSGGVSIASISRNFGISEASVFNLLNALEKAGVIFSIKPYGSAKNMANSAWKYYFSSPTLQASLLWSIGKLNRSSETMGPLLETAVADTLYRKNILSSHKVNGLFFDYRKGGADFIVKTPLGSIAVECGWGEKETSQVKKTMREISAYMGINVCNSVDRENMDNILSIKKELFLMM